MKEYEFTLKFQLPANDNDPEKFIDRLYECGCSDALVGIGQIGRIGLDFTREAESAEEAIVSALTNVKEAIPGAELIEASPDLVGISEIAEMIGCSRQNMRNVFETKRGSLPAPVYEGKMSLWHLSSVLESFKTETDYQFDQSLFEVSITNLKLNITKELVKNEKSLEPALKVLFV